MKKWIGGSVNGRPFRESSDSYSRTGIPCGNPKRYQSHEVVRMETGPRSRPKPIDGPLESIETEGQKQLKSMLQKQIDKSATIEQQLGQKREFSEGVNYQFSTDEVSGIQTLKEFKALGDVDDYIEEMRGYGLTHEEILYKLESENNETMVKKSRLSHPDYHEARLKEIDAKIARKKETLSKMDTFANMKPISRHEMELENAISMANSKNKFLHKTLIAARENKTVSDPNNSLNCIPEILENWSKKSSLKKKCHGKKQKDYLTECKLECCVPQNVASLCLKCKSNQNEARKYENEAEESESEANTIQDKSCDFAHCTCENDGTVQTCAEKPEDYVSNVEEKLVEKKCSEKKVKPKSTSFSVKTGNEISMTSDLDSTEDLRTISEVEAVPEDVIRKYKLSLEDVKKIPRFENYTAGEPSNVLFVKNLSSKVTEEDLASLFIQFQSDERQKIIFKLLNGRMKGQAFVTFTDTETAMKALDLVNGFEFKGKPVIIQYGRKQT